MRNKEFDPERIEGLREMTPDEIEKITATGTYTAKQLCDTEYDIKLRETQNIIKMLRKHINF